MKNKVLVIGIAATAVFAGGWALAQSSNDGPGGFGPAFMRDHGHGGMGREMMQHKGRGMGEGMMQHMHSGMGGGMMPRMHSGMGPGAMHGGPGFALGDPARIETLKGELGISPAQEAAWAQYAKALQDAAAATKDIHEGVDPDAVSKMSPQDRFAFMTKMREQGQKQFETVQVAANELLAALDDRQKTKARETLPGLAFGPGMMRGAGASGPHHRHQDH